MASLISWAKKKVQQTADLGSRVVDQVNTMDGGKTFQQRTPTQSSVPAMQQAKNAVRGAATRTVNQFNPLDNGRTGKQLLPTNNRSTVGQLTHNGLTNTIGNVGVKPITSTFAIPVEAARSTVAEMTHNRNAYQAAEQRIQQNIDQSLPGAVAHQAVNAYNLARNTPDAIRADIRGFQGKAPTAEQQLALNRGLKALNNTVPGQMNRINEGIMTNFIPGAKESLAAAGVEDTSIGKQFADVGMGTVGAIMAKPTLNAGLAGAKTVDMRVRAANDRAGTVQAITSQQKQLAREAEAFKKQQQSLPVDNHRAAEVLQRKIDRNEGQITQLEEARPKLNLTDRILTAQPGMSMKAVNPDLPKKPTPPSTKPVGQTPKERYSIANSDITREKSPGMNQDGFTVEDWGGKKRHVSLDGATLKTRQKIRQAEAEYEAAKSASTGPVAPGTKGRVQIAKEKIDEAYSDAIDELKLHDYATTNSGKRTFNSRYNDWLETKYKDRNVDSTTIKDMATNPQKYRSQFEAETTAPVNSTTPKAVSPDAAVPAQAPVVPKSPVGSPLPNDTPTKPSRFANRTVQNSDEVSPELKQLVKDEKVQYNPTTNAGRLDTAEQSLAGKSDDDNFATVLEGLKKGKDDPAGQSKVTAIAFAKKLDAQADEASQFKATEIYHELSQRLSEAGQEVQAAALLAGRTPQGLKYKATKDLKNALGDKFTADIQRELNQRVEAVKKAKPGTDADAIARDNLQYFVARNTPTTTSDKIVNFWRAGLLTAPTTTGGAGVGNAAMTGIRKLWINPGAAITDSLISLKTGQRSFTLAKPGEFGRGAKRGAQNATSSQYWKTGYDPMNPMANADTMGTTSRVTNYGTGRLGTATGAYVNGVYKLMGAADQPFRYGAHDEILSSLAKADAANQGLRGADATQHVNDFINDPPEWAQERATSEALDATFQNKTALAATIQSTKQGLKQKGYHKTAAIVDFLVPFSGVPSAVADRAIRHSGVKAGIEVTKALLNARKGEKLTLAQQRDLAKYVSEGTVGLPIVAAGFALAQAGKFTGAYPTDQKERDLWKAQRKQENSVKIGDRWYSMNYIQPFGVLMSLGAGIQQTKGDNGKTAAIEDYVTNGAASAVKSFAGQSYLQGLQGPLDAFNDPEQNASKYVASVSSSIVPNGIRSLASASDRIQRETKGVVAGIKGAIPGVRKGLPAKQDMFGQDIPAKDTPANMYLNPLKPSKERTDATVTELGRLNVMPTKAAKDAIKGATLTAAQVHELNGLAGPAMKKEYDRVIASADYNNMGDDDKKKALQKIDDTVYGSLKQQYAADKGLLAKADLSGNQKQYLNSGKVDITGMSLPKGMNGNDVATLKRFEGLKPNEKEAIFTKEPQAEYKLKLAQFERDKKNGNFTDAELAGKKAEVFKARVGSEFPKEVRDVYGMSKNKATAYLANSKNGNKLADQVIAYGDSLAGNGIEDNKFVDSKGNVAIVPKGTKIEAKSDRASKTAQKYGVPDNIFAALIKQESGGNQGARSQVGAIGLTQLMPETARGLGVDPTDPDQNLDGGARYLKAQYDKFKSWPLALAAYNAGPGAVEKYGGIPPFEETQNYVKNIMAMVNGGIKGDDLTLVLNDPNYTGGGLNRSGVDTSSTTGSAKKSLSAVVDAARAGSGIQVPKTAKAPSFSTKAGTSSYKKPALKQYAVKKTKVSLRQLAKLG